MATGTESRWQDSNFKVESIYLNGTQVTATAAELNAFAGGGLSAAEIAVLDGVTAGTVTASKAVVAGASKEILGLNTVTAASTINLALNTTSDDRQVRINSRSFTQAAGDTMAFQAKPSQTVTTTGSVQGGQISPRLQDAIAAGNLIGLHIDTDLKGTTGNISGAIKGIELELVSDGTRTSTVTGDVSGITFRSNMAMTISGHCTPIKWFQHETAAGAWDGLIKLDAALGTLSGTTASDKTGGTDLGTIKVILSDGNIGHIAIYAD